MLLTATLGTIALLSVVLLVWQWFAALRFPLHKLISERVKIAEKQPPAPGVTLLKPLKGADRNTRECLRSWFTQQYNGPIQILFGVADCEDLVCPIVRNLIEEFPAVDAELMICTNLAGTNLKASKLAQLLIRARHELVVISDADVLAPPDLLARIVPLLDGPEVGLVNCFYSLANPTTLAMHWESIAVNADFWSQVLQSQTLKPLDFALGAVMATRRGNLQQIGGFESLKDCLADDYQLGHRISKAGGTIKLADTVVECWSDPMSFRQVWKHQLRWARTVRVCQPTPYFFSILSNPTLWPLIWLIFIPSRISAWVFAAAILVRCFIAADLQRRLNRRFPTIQGIVLAPVKDLLQLAIWVLAFAGNRIEWRGEKLVLRRDGTLVRPGVSSV